MGEQEPAQLLRDVVHAGLRYYARLGRLALRGGVLLVPALRELRPEMVPAPAAASGGAPPPSLSRGDRTVLLEAPAGKPGLGVFLVENVTSAPVSAGIAVSALSGPGGEEAPLTLRFSPNTISLDPGDQVLVQMAAVIDDGLEPGARYRAEISIPGLSGVRVPIVVRRRPAEEDGV